MTRLIAFAAASLVVLAGCGSGSGCETVLLDPLASPDGAHEARAWRRACEGAAADDLHFELVEAGAPQRDVARREQVFLIGEGDRGDYRLSWRAPGALSVTLAVPEDSVLKAEPDLEVGERTVVISYTRESAGED